VIRSFEARVVLRVLPQTVGIRGKWQAKVLLRKHACHGDIHSQSLGILPTRDGDVSWPAARCVPQNESLFQDWRQETLLAYAMDEIPQAIVTHDNVRVPLAASGVVAENIKWLRAKGAQDITAGHPQPKTVPNRCAEHLRGQATVGSVEIGRNGSHPRTCVLGQQTCEPLVVSDQARVDGLVDCKGGLSLRAAMQISLGRPSPRLVGSGL